MLTKYLKFGENSRIAYMYTNANASPENPVTILYLGGLCSNMHGTKASLINDWASQHTLPMLRFDYQGHGESSGTFTDFGIDHWADDAVRVVDELITGKVLLVGSSLGGWIAAILAMRRPERILGFVGLASAPDFTEHNFRSRLTDLEICEIDAGHIIELNSGYIEPYRIGRALMEGGEKCAVLNSEIKMNFPVRLLQGMDDQSVTIEQALQFAQAISSDDLELSLIKSADHGLSRPQDMKAIFEKITEILDLSAIKCDN